MNISSNLITVVLKINKTQRSTKFDRLSALQVGYKIKVTVFPFQSERHFIMQVVCEATQSQDTRVKVAALQCLVKIMSLYYMYMETYMGPALFAVSIVK